MVARSGMLQERYAYTPCEDWGADPNETASRNTEALIAALAVGGYVTLTKPGVYYINSTLTIYSNTHLYIGPGVTIRLAPSINRMMMVNAAYARSDTTIVSLTSSGITATARTEQAHGFAVGDYVAVNWATPEYYAGVYEVLSVPSAYEFTYALPALPSATTASAGSGGTMKVRLADTNITVENHGVMDYDGSNQVGTFYNAMGCIFSHVFKLKVSGRFINADKFNILIACASNVHCEDIFCSGPSDGLHFTGPIFSAYVNGIDGDNSDNLLACGAGDYSGYLISEGAIIGFRARQITAHKNSVSPVRVWGTSAYSFEGEIDGVYGSSNTVPMVQAIQDGSVLPDGNSYLRSLTVRNVRGAANGSDLIELTPKTIDYLLVERCEAIGLDASRYVVALGTASVTYDHVTFADLTSDQGANAAGLIFIAASVTVNNLALLNCRYITSSTGMMIICNTSSTIQSLVAKNCVYSTGSSGGMFEFRGTLEHADIDACYAAGSSSSKFVNIASTAVITDIAMRGCYSDTCHWVVNSAMAADLELEVVGCTLKAGSGNVFRHTAASGVMRIRSQANRFPSITQAVVRTSTGTFECYGWDIPGDPINAAMATTSGQFMLSTQAAAEGGPSVRVSGGWAALGSGASFANQQIT